MSSSSRRFGYGTRFRGASAPRRQAYQDPEWTTGPDNQAEEDRNQIRFPWIKLERKSKQLCVLSACRRRCAAFRTPQLLPSTKAIFASADHPRVRWQLANRQSLVPSLTPVTRTDEQCDSNNLRYADFWQLGIAVGVVGADFRAIGVALSPRETTML